jgi:prophage maintenance system killer protein
MAAFLRWQRRAGLAVALAFLGLNGLWLEADPDELAALVVSVAEGTTTKAEIAEFVRQHVEALES